MLNLVLSLVGIMNIMKISHIKSIKKCVDAKLNLNGFKYIKACSLHMKQIVEI
jgi:hypothetical protein